MSDLLPPALAKGERGGVYFLHGSDRFRKGEAVRALVDLHLDPSTRDFNLDSLRGSELSVESLASVVATPPMMAEWRVVVVREVEALASSPRARELLLSLVQDPPPELALILEASIPKKSKARLYQDLKKGARSVEFREVSPNDVPGWLMTWTRDRHGAEMDPDAARALAAAVGVDLGVLVREVEKLLEVAGGSGRITMEEVRAAGTRLPRENRWNWFDLVGERRFEEALNGLSILLAQGESGVGLTAGLTTHLLRIGVLVEQGFGALQSTLPPPQRGFAGKLRSQGTKWTGEEVEAALLGLRRVDRLLKSSGLSEEHHLEEWLLVYLSPVGMQTA
ncbi:DNA polymerase III subunit delta [Gemmatimonadota bacterium]